jgi:hypothetical protein
MMMSCCMNGPRASDDGWPPLPAAETPERGHLSVTRDGLTAYVSDLENNRLTVWRRGCRT